MNCACAASTSRPAISAGPISPRPRSTRKASIASATPACLSIRKTRCRASSSQAAWWRISSSPPAPSFMSALCAATPVVQDALVAGQDRPFVGLLAWPNLHACRQIVGDPDASYEDVVRHPDVRACLKRGLQAHNKSTEGASSMRIARAMLMIEPASIDGNELTDKGYINQRAGLDRRAALVERLYGDRPGEDVIILN